MRRARRLMPALCFALALVLGFLLAVGLSGCERPGPPGRIASPGAMAASSAAPDASTATALPLPLPPASEPTPSRADLDAGARLASQGAGAVPACMGCHDRGASSDVTVRVRAAVARTEARTEHQTDTHSSMADERGHTAHDGHAGAEPTAPRLAGQGAAYLRRQLNAYADGTRPHPVMTPIAQSLLADQRRQLAAYFAALGTAPLASPPPASAPSAAPSATPIETPIETPIAPDGAASRLAWVGDEARQLPACANCHGRDGSGQGDRIPPLAGQPAAYLEAALEAWRTGRRTTDASGEMPRIAQALRPGEARLLAAWYAALPSPRPATQALPPFVSRLAPLSSGPSTVGPAPRGVGAEQGAPLTGGGQGPGGGGATVQGAGTPGTAPPSSVPRR